MGTNVALLFLFDRFLLVAVLLSTLEPCKLTTQGRVPQLFRNNSRTIITIFKLKSQQLSTQR